MEVLGANSKINSGWTLAEVGDPSGEEGLDFIAGDVRSHARTRAFGMGHFSEHASAGAGNPLDRGERTIRVDGDVHGRVTVCIAVLRGDLALVRELSDEGGGCVELPFAMGNGDAVDVADRAFGKPRGEIADHAGASVAGNVAADLVMNERRGICAGIANFAVRHEARFHEGLKAVADAENETVAILE